MKQLKLLFAFFSANAMDDYEDLNKKFIELVRSKILDEESYEQLFNLLLEGADINYKQWGFSALHFALLKNDIKLFQWLLHMGADRSVRDPSNRTLQEVAGKFPEIARVIKAFRPAINEENILEVSFNNIDRCFVNQERLFSCNVLKMTNCGDIYEILNCAKFFNKFNMLPNCFILVIHTDKPNRKIFLPPAYGTMFNTERPIVICLESTEFNQVFYKNSNSKELIEVNIMKGSALNEPIFNSMMKRNFSFELLLQALNANIGGVFEERLLEARVNAETFYNYFYVNDDAIMHRSSALILRFLGLFVSTQGELSEMLKLAARKGNEETFIALLQLPFNCQSAAFDIKYRVMDDLEFTHELLKLSVENCNDASFNFLRNFTLNLNHCQQLLFELLTLAAHHEYFKLLLQIYDAYPTLCNTYVLPKACGVNIEDLPALVKDIEQFIQHIKEGSINGVRTLAKKHPRFKQIPISRNQSALTIALKCKQFQVYAELKSLGFRPQQNEGFERMKQKLQQDDTKRLAQALRLNFPGAKDPHIIQLMICSRLGYDVEECEHEELFQIIQKAFEKLNAIPWIQPILQIIANSRHLIIVFDFNRDSVSELDPMKPNPGIKGTNYVYKGFIFVGAKGLKEETENLQNYYTVLGTLVHEMTHFAMQLLYKNDCRPYASSDDQKKEKFEEIISQFSNDTREIIVRRVYVSHQLLKRCADGQQKPIMDKRPAELIVRVTQLLAHYSKEETELAERKEWFKTLFDYYEKNILNDLKSNFPMLKDLQIIEDANNLYDILLKVLSLEMKPNSKNPDCNFDDVSHNILFCKTNSILVAMSLISKIFKEKKISFVLAKIEFVDFELYRNMMITAYQSKLSPVLVIDFSSWINISMKNFRNFMNDFLPTCRMIFLSKKDCSETDKVLKTLQNSFRQIDLKDFSLDDFSAQYCEQLLTQKFSFQNHPVEFNKVFSIDSPSLKLIPIDCIFSEDFSVMETTQNEEMQDLVDRYVERNFSRNKQSDDNDQLLSISTDELMEDPRIVKIIAGEPGMGKSWTLKMIAKKLKKIHPDHWHVELDIKRHMKVFKDELKFKNCGKEVKKFLAEKILELSELEREIFAELFDAGKIDVFCDEICPTSEASVLDLLLSIKNTSRGKLWVTSRTNRVGKLEKTLEALSFRLKPFTREDQREFLTKHFAGNANAEKIVERISEISKDMAQEIAKVPQMLKMLAEIYEDGKSSDKINFYSFCKQLVEKLLAVWTESGRLNGLFDATSIRRAHQISALQKVLSKEAFDRLLISPIKIESAKETIEQIGLVNVDVSRNLEFHLEKFANFFVCDQIICDIFDSKMCKEDPLKTLSILYEILLVKSYETVRMFLDNAIENFAEVNSFNVEYCRDFLSKILTDTKKFSILHNSIKEGRFNVISTIVEILKGNESLTKDLLLSKDNYGRNIFLSAVSHCQDVNFLKSFWKLSRTFLGKTERENMMLDRDCKGRNCLLDAAFNSNKHVLEFLWDSSEIHESEEVKIKFLSSTDPSKRNALHLAASFNEKSVLEALLKFANVLSIEQKKNFLTNKIEYGKSVFGLAVRYNKNTDVLEYLLEYSQKNLSARELKEILICQKDENGFTTLHEAAAFGSSEVFEVLWKFINDKYKSNEVEEFLITEDESAAFDSREISKSLWENIEDKFKSDDIKKSLLAEDKLGRNALVLAFAYNQDVDVVDSVWKVYKKAFSANKLKKILTKKMTNGNSILHMISRTNGKDVLVMFWNYSVDDRDQKKFLTREGYKKRSVFAVAAVYNKNLDFLSMLWEKMEQNLSKDELKNILTSKDSENNSPIHLACLNNRAECVEYVLKLMQKVLTREEQINLILRDGEKKRKVLSLAAGNNQDVNVITSLMKYCKKLLNKNQIEKLLSSHDEQGNCAIHVAAAFRNELMLKAIWICVEESFHFYQLANFISRKDQNGRNLLYKALVFNNNLEVLRFIFALSESFLDNNSMKEFLTAHNKQGYAAITKAQSCNQNNEKDEMIVSFTEMYNLYLSKAEQRDALSNHHRPKSNECFCVDIKALATK